MFNEMIKSSSLPFCAIIAHKNYVTEHAEKYPGVLSCFGKLQIGFAVSMSFPKIFSISTVANRPLWSMVMYFPSRNGSHFSKSSAERVIYGISVILTSVFGSCACAVNKSEAVRIAASASLVFIWVMLV